MGEKIRDIKLIKLSHNTLLVEQNKGTHKGSMYDIHIQNSNFRLNISDSDYYKIAASIMYAAENLRNYKELDNE